MVDTNELIVPYSIECWKSKVPTILFNTNTKLVIEPQKYYLKVNNIFFAEIAWDDVINSMQIVRFIEEEEHEELDKRVDNFEIQEYSDLKGVLCEQFLTK